MNHSNKPSKIMIRISSMAGAAVVFAAATAFAQNPDLPFSSGSTGADGPLDIPRPAGGRQGHALAFDAARNQLVLFGGNTGNPSNDTWVWDGKHWTFVQPFTRPKARFFAHMVYDEARQEIVLFGGDDGNNSLNDTWVWNGTDWKQRTPETSPPARSRFAMTYDPVRQRVWMFGGNVAPDVWLWDGNNWSSQSPTTKPTQRQFPAAAYDAARDRIVLFGGDGKRETWLWDGANNTWTQVTPNDSPGSGYFHTLAYDSVRQEVLYFSGQRNQETWVWDNLNWRRRFPATAPSGRQYHAMTWHAGLKRIVLFGGDAVNDGTDADTWSWDGTAWQFHGGKNFTFDMTAKADGVWNFTTVDVPGGVSVFFKKNAANTPVRWLASGNVTINGTLNLEGQHGLNSIPTGFSAQGGPGGFPGGRGAARADQSGSIIGSPGQGPGGGLPGTSTAATPTRDGKIGNFNGPDSSYGNVYLQPLIGGSGGGGGASSQTVDGGNGGGGGGAILISSSRDITHNGRITVRGGNRQFSSVSYGGGGAGGAILFRADRVLGGCSLEAHSGDEFSLNGRIRIEAYVRTFSGAQSPISVQGLPAANGELNAAGQLVITQVAGQNVVAQPSGNLLTPDVVFSQAGPIVVNVRGTGIPNGTPVKLRIATGNSVIEVPAGDGPAVTLNNGTASFNATVPKGVGTLQAFAEYTVAQ